MTPDKINRAIAEAAGWTHVEPKAHIDITWPWGYLPNDPKCNHPAPIPAYTSDLNAMHEAEKTLSEAKMFIMAEYIERLVSRHGRHYFHATAAQRAEAFLRTLGKWEDKK